MMTNFLNWKLCRRYSVTMMLKITMTHSNKIIIMKYTKVPLKGHVTLDVYPVYIEDVYHGHEPFRIVGIRHNEVELKGDWSGMNMTIGNVWKPISKCFLVKK